MKNYPDNFNPEFFQGQEKIWEIEDALYCNSGRKFPEFYPFKYKMYYQISGLAKLFLFEEDGTPKTAGFAFEKDFIDFEKSSEERKMIYCSIEAIQTLNLAPTIEEALRLKNSR